MKEAKFAKSSSLNEPRVVSKLLTPKDLAPEASPEIISVPLTLYMTLHEDFCKSLKVIAQVVL